MSNKIWSGRRVTKGFIRGVTPLVFILKAVVAALKAFPQFNASLDASGENLILKNIVNNLSSLENVISAIQTLLK